MKKRLISALLVLVLAICVFPVSAFAANLNESGDFAPMSALSYYINANNVNLRSGPGTSYTSGGQVNNGDTLEFVYGYNGTFSYYGEGYNWYHVRMVSGQCAAKKGYVVSAYVSSRPVQSLD